MGKIERDPEQAPLFEITPSGDLTHIAGKPVSHEPQSSFVPIDKGGDPRVQGSLSAEELAKQRGEARARQVFGGEEDEKSGIPWYADPDRSY